MTSFSIMSRSDQPRCGYCDIGAGRRAANIVAEDEATVTFMYGRPATRGHLIVFPRVHSAALYDVSEADAIACMLTAKHMASRAVAALGATGVNLLNNSGGDAWQLVPHFHLHVIPRYPNDPLRLPWDLHDEDPLTLAVTADLIRGAL